MDGDDDDDDDDDNVIDDKTRNIRSKLNKIFSFSDKSKCEDVNMECGMNAWQTQNPPKPTPRNDMYINIKYISTTKWIAFEMFIFYGISSMSHGYVSVVHSTHYTLHK